MGSNIGLTSDSISQKIMYILKIGLNVYQGYYIGASNINIVHFRKTAARSG